ncbi:hypothetical protein J3R83DRAFT_7258 [Lanmaoa asiatica]|nr:hypothetical protein J3R83DRAFT_7258 [Lanmaoa asiatica]
MSGILPGKPITGRPISLPQVIPRVPLSRSPRIQIPYDRSLQPGPNSPITSSPKESDLHLRYRHMSHPVELSSQTPGLVYPPSASPPEFSPSPISSRDRNSDRRFTHGMVPPPRIQIPGSRLQRGSPNSPWTSSSEESDFHSIYHHIGPMSPGRRVTPPRTSPPEVPLPPIPSDDQDDQDVDSNSFTSKTNSSIEQPLTPVRCAALDPSTPVRPLPTQPIPSPVPGSDDSISTNSLAQHWQGSNGDLLSSDDVVRQDSPVYVLHDETGIGPPPPYVDQVDTYSPPDTPTIGDALDRAVDVCGGSPQVRLEVSKCIGFHSGYEPPYWQTRLQACGLNAGAAKYLVDEMSKQVDWSASFTRSV